MDSASAQALGQFIGDGIAVAALSGVLWQLDLQRRELAQQRKQSAAADKERREEDALRRKREELLDEQLADLRQEREGTKRQQVNKIEIRAETSTVTPSGITIDVGDELHAISLVNNSDRPIRNVRGGIRIDEAQYQDAGVRYRLLEGSFPNGLPMKVVHDKSENYRIDVVRTGEKWLFAFSYSSKIQNHAKMAVRLIDDAGVEWQIDTDMHVTPLPANDWVY